MLDVGNITQAMHDPARDFQAAFTIASLDRMPSASLVLVQPPGTRGSGDLTEAQVGARERVARALDALGGPGSPEGSCIWFVVGLQTSLGEWALRQGWGGRPVRQESAQGSSSRRSACSRSTTAIATGRDADARELRRLALLSQYCYKDRKWKF